MYCHDSELIFPPFSHDEMQANIKATNNNNWFPATSKKLLHMEDGRSKFTSA
jgi:hypothetical protein